MEYCPDEMERAHQAGLPGERLVECDRCGELVHYHKAKLYNNNKLICEECSEELIEENQS